MADTNRLNRDDQNGFVPDYKSMIEHSFDAVYLIKGMRFVYANPRLVELTGYSPEELTDPEFDFLSLLPEKSREIVTNQYQARQEGDTMPHKFDIRIFTRAGEIKDIEIYTTPVNDKNHDDVFVMGIARDITERRKMESDLAYLTRFQHHLMKLGVGFINCPLGEADNALNSALAEMGNFTGADRAYVYQYDQDNKLASNTHEWCREGISTQKEILQDISMDLISEWTDIHFKGKAISIADTSKLPWSDSIRKIIEDRDVKSVITIPMMYENFCIGFVGFDAVRGIKKWGGLEIDLLKLFAELLTNLKIKNNYESSLQTAREKAEESDRLKTAFLANMSHEIRTPMNCIVGFSTLMKRKKTGEEKREKYIDIINSNAYHLLDIINNILDVAKIESGQIDIIKESVNPVDLFSGLQDMFVTSSPKVQLRFHEPDIPIFIGDTIKIKQILVNLISNALKHTSEGSVDVSAYREESSLVFCVKDTGTGISAEDQPHIFERFMKGSESKWMSRGGTGLGLSIVKSYVEKMGGRTWFSSRWEEGTSFYFSIPFISS